jgi:hypothetical protein
MSTVEKISQTLQILLNEYQVAEKLNISVSGVRRMRLFGRGPRYKNIGNLVRYDPRDLEDWLQAQPGGGGK